jgi:hypothetical protein
LPNSFRRLSRLMVLAGMVTYLPPDSIAHDVAHVGVVLIEARDLIQHTLVYTTHVCTENRPRRANLHDWNLPSGADVGNGRSASKLRDRRSQADLSFSIGPFPPGRAAQWWLASRQKPAKHRRFAVSWDFQSEPHETR